MASEGIGQATSRTLDVLMIVWRRAQYTHLSLTTLLEMSARNTRVWIWQNGRDLETSRVLASFANHPNIARIHVSEENVKLREPTNWFWSQSSSAFLAKVDDDCLVPRGWDDTLIDAHLYTPRLGIFGCWHYYDEDFIPELARRKTCDLHGGHQIMRNCWIGGSGYVMKRALVDQMGPIQSDESFPAYGIRAALAGWENGWHFPFIHMEHMDDPRSKYTRIRDQADFVRERPLSAVTHNVRSINDLKQKEHAMARYLQEAPWDPWYYSGWRLALRRIVNRVERLAGLREPWRDWV